jgi:hypothetical protein
MWFDKGALPKVAKVLGDGGWGEANELANFPEWGDSIFHEVFQDDNSGGVCLGFVP